jgi:hypothetical protein
MALTDQEAAALGGESPDSDFATILLAQRAAAGAQDRWSISSESVNENGKRGLNPIAEDDDELSDWDEPASGFRFKSMTRVTKRQRSDGDFSSLHPPLDTQPFTNAPPRLIPLPTPAQSQGVQLVPPISAVPDLEDEPLDEGPPTPTQDDIVTFSDSTAREPKRAPEQADYDQSMMLDARSTEAWQITGSERTASGTSLGSEDTAHGLAALEQQMRTVRFGERYGDGGVCIESEDCLRSAEDSYSLSGAAMRSLQSSA